MGLTTDSYENWNIEYIENENQLSAWKTFNKKRWNEKIREGRMVDKMMDRMQRRNLKWLDKAHSTWSEIAIYSRLRNNSFTIQP